MQYIRANRFNRSITITRLAIFCLLAMLFLAVLAGCGTANGTGPSGNGLTLNDPIPDATKLSSISGTLFTLAQGLCVDGTTSYYVIDQAANTTVSLTGTPNDTATYPAPYTRSTISTSSGGYSFANVPPGTYTISATSTSTNASPVTVTGTLNNVAAVGNIPTLAANLLLGDANSMATISGTITDHNSTAVPNATVTLEVNGNPQNVLQQTAAPSQANDIAVMQSTITDGSGHYSFQVPTGADGYIVAAHAGSSPVAESDWIPSTSQLTLRPDEIRSINIQLAGSGFSPVFPNLSNFWVTSTTLPQPTQQAADQALTTQFAVARATHAPQAVLTHLQRRVQLRQSRQTALRDSPVGIVENDLQWYCDNIDPNVQGYYAYSASSSAGPFTKIGTLTDPYAQALCDNNPSLTTDRTTYYSITAYGGNNVVSSPSPVQAAVPMPPMVVTTPNLTSLPQNAATVQWSAQPQAVIYYVVVYQDSSASFNAPPTFNSVPVYLVGTTSPYCTLMNANTGMPLAPGHYWWSVVAYNSTYTNVTGAATFSAYQQLTITAN